MNKATVLILFLLTVTFFSCKRQPVSSTIPTANGSGLVRVQEIDYTYFSAKSKVNYKDATENLTATVNIRMKKDSIIWLSVAKLGIEGVRSVITQDSIYVDNKLKNEFTAYDFNTLSKQFNFNLSFDLIQAAILGNLPLDDTHRDKVKMVKEKDYYLLRQDEDSIIINNYIDMENLKLKKISMVEQQTSNVLSLDYENFNLINNFLFPYNSIISLQYNLPQGNSNTLISIQHNKVEFTDKEMKFPFNASRKYGNK